MSKSWEESSIYYKFGYTEGYNYKMKLLGGDLLPNLETPITNSLEDVRDEMIGQTLGEIDACTIFWARQGLNTTN